MGQFHSALCAFAQTIGKKRKELETAPAFLRPLLEQTVAAYEVDYLLQYEQLRRIDAMFEGFARLKMDTKMVRCSRYATEVC